MSRRSLWLNTLFAVPMLAMAQPPAPSIAVRARDTLVDLSLGTLHKTLDLTGRVYSPALKTAKVLFQAHKDGHYYLVLDVAGPTVPGGGASQCGGGEEDSLVWMDLSDHFSPLDIQSVPYSSCATNADGDLDVTKGGVRTTFTYAEDYQQPGSPGSEWIRCSAAYDAARPEQGLHVQRTVVPDSEADK